MCEYFEEFFKCPNCGKPIVSKEELTAYAEQHGKYCGSCGHEMTNALAAALDDVGNN